MDKISTFGWEKLISNIKLEWFKEKLMRFFNEISSSLRLFEEDLEHFSIVFKWNKIFCWSDSESRWVEKFRIPLWKLDWKVEFPKFWGTWLSSRLNEERIEADRDCEDETGEAEVRIRLMKGIGPGMVK